MLLLAFKLLSRLPLALLHALGAVLGRVVYWASATYRQRLRANLRQAGLDADALASTCAAEAGKQMLESAWIWFRPRAEVVGKLRWVDDDVLSAALQERRPLLLLTPHLGCFEVIAQGFVLRADARDRPMTILYRRPRKKALVPLVEQGRAHPGLLLAPADMRGVRMLMRALRSGHVAGLLPDQVPAAGEGLWAPFFGRPAFTMVLPAKLALGANAIVLVLAGKRLPRGAGYEVYVQRLQQQFSGDPLADATLINRAIEEMVLRLPTQYLWGYNRYKKPANAPEPPPLAEPQKDPA